METAVPVRIPNGRLSYLRIHLYTYLGVTVPQGHKRGTTVLSTDVSIIFSCHISLDTYVHVGKSVSDKFVHRLFKIIKPEIGHHGT